MADIPVSGSILRYPYLWAWQRDKGEPEGRKSRPVCLVLALPKGKQTHLIILAISGTPPRPDQSTPEIPQLECRRAGVRDWKEAWITVSEFNHDIAEASFCMIRTPRCWAASARAFWPRSPQPSSHFFLVWMLRSTAQTDNWPSTASGSMTS